MIRVDIDPRFKPDIVADVRALPLKPFHVDVLWASPPCQEFSRSGLPWFLNKGSLPDPDMSMVEAVKRFVAEMKPRFWMVENVRNSRKWITPILGPIWYRSSGHFLWGKRCQANSADRSDQRRMGQAQRLGRLPRRMAPQGKLRTIERQASTPRQDTLRNRGDAICRAVEMTAFTR